MDAVLLVFWMLIARGTEAVGDNLSRNMDLLEPGKQSVSLLLSGTEDALTAESAILVNEFVRDVEGVVPMENEIHEPRRKIISFMSDEGGIFFASITVDDNDDDDAVVDRIGDVGEDTE
jgi:hypothetical protein